MSADEDRKNREYKSLGSCILSASFWLILVWQMLLELDMVFTFGALNLFLTRLADGDENVGKSNCHGARSITPIEYTAGIHKPKC